jgi:cytochrome c-550 PedF
MTTPLGRLALLAAAALASGAIASSLSAHGDVTPQAVDTTALPDLAGGNDSWVTVNPYRGNQKALEIGQSAYGQNCARCHGLGAISGGIAPDLRYLEQGDTGDEWFIDRFRHGAVRDGKVYMPPMGEVLGQKAGWAIRTWIESKYTEE